jgi:hypothetical protein
VVHLPKLIQSSGVPKYDALVLKGISRIRYKTPERLDGVPIPVFAYVRFNVQFTSGSQGLFWYGGN